MNEIIKRIDRNDIIMIFTLFILALSFVFALLGNNFAKEVFQALFVIPITTYMVGKGGK